MCPDFSAALDQEYTLACSRVSFAKGAGSLRRSAVVCSRSGKGGRQLATFFEKVRASLSRGALYTLSLQPGFTEFVLSVASKVNSMSASRISVHVHPLRPALRNCVLVRLSSPAEPPALCVPVGSQFVCARRRPLSPPGCSPQC